MTPALQLVKPPPLNRGRPKKFTPETIEQIRNLAERGKSRDEIAEIIGVTIGTLQVTCSKLGISLRQPRFDMATGLLSRPRSRYQKNGTRLQTSEKKCAEENLSETTTTEEARAGAPSVMTSPGKMNGGTPSAFAIRMQYKGQERSIDLPFDKEMIAQLAIEAEILGMRIGEFVATLIRAILKKDLLHLIRNEAYPHMHGPHGSLGGRAGNTPSDVVRVLRTASRTG
jgi:hypothetical protein